jgi:hypothetical protein
MFVKLISHLPAPLLRACAYAKAFALLEDPSMPAHTRARPYEPHRPDTATPALPALPPAQRKASCAEGRPRELLARRAPRRHGAAPANLQPCATPIALSPAFARSTADPSRPQRRTGRPCGRPVIK